jgi:hypothetical protein
LPLPDVPGELGKREGVKRVDHRTAPCMNMVTTPARA